MGRVRERQHWEKKGDANSLHKEREGREKMNTMMETLKLQQLAEDQHEHFNTNAEEEAEQLNVAFHWVS